MTQRVIVYIDGFNLYFGMCAKGWRKYLWLDLAALSRALLKPSQQLEWVHYFTARIRAKGPRKQSAKRQTTYLEALGALPNLSIHEGHYLSKQDHCRQCGATWPAFEEKMTDVNIATALLIDAFDDRFDTALILSGDSDLTTPVRSLRARFQEKRVIVALPPARRSHQLSKAANGHFVIGADSLRNSLLPEQIKLPRGHVLQRPEEWR